MDLRMPQSPHRDTQKSDPMKKWAILWVQIKEGKQNGSHHTWLEFFHIKLIFH